MFTVVPQLGCMGCAVSAVAAVAGIRSYAKALKLFREPERHESEGFGKRRVLEALRSAKMSYVAKRFADDGVPLGAIVFVRRGEADRLGHYVVRDHDGWLDSMDRGRGTKSKTARGVDKAGAGWAPQTTGVRWRNLPLSYRPEGLYLAPA